jgi:ribosomal-protein-alanine N-acetyltransferase
MIDQTPATDVVVRPMREADVATVVAIETETFSSPWQEDTFAGLLDRPGVELLVMESPAAGVIGYAVLWCVLDQAELANVAITSKWRGRGLGRRLIGSVIEAAQERGIAKVFLEVRASNDRAANIYRGFGFTEVGLRRGYYSDPDEDARIMMATLPARTPAS